jgi:lysophospholipase L1-like esterase
MSLISRASSVLFFLLPLPSLPAQPVKVMPLGDSITRGTNDINFPNGSIPGGYRRDLGIRLTNAGLVHDFVGENSDNAAAGMDPDHNGNNGFRTDEILANLPTWLAVMPEVVLLMAGTNDILQDVSVATAAGNLSALIDAITSDAPQRRLHVATLIPITQDWEGNTAAYLNANAEAYNTQVRALVQQYANAGRRVSLVDMNARIVLAGSVPAEDFYQPGDGIHPGQAGYDQMAAIWFDEVVAAWPVSYQTWAAAQAGLQALPLQERLPAADPNQDGISNLMAYALALDPLAFPPADALPVVIPDEDGTPFFQYQRSRKAMADFQVFTSPDLLPESWQPHDFSGASGEIVTGNATLEKFLLPFPGGAGSGFARLRVLTD